MRVCHQHRTGFCFQEGPGFFKTDFKESNRCLSQRHIWNGLWAAEPWGGVESAWMLSNEQVAFTRAPEVTRGRQGWAASAEWALFEESHGQRPRLFPALPPSTTDLGDFLPVAYSKTQTLHWWPNCWWLKRMEVIFSPGLCSHSVIATM